MYIPYETLARAEASDIVDGSRENVLASLTPEQTFVVSELLADAYNRGLEHGFALSDSHTTDPISVIEAYQAGIEQGMKERGDS